MRAGLALLSTLPAKKRVYVTPGLVDQGVENERVHNQLGQLIADANPDKVVLMQNSNTSFIQQGLTDGGYRGELVIEDQPLEFYTQLEHYLAAGDVYMLQNDLPDSYR
jgi:UDP-N-acetylmuramyl pentapeptide synthase